MIGTSPSIETKSLSDLHEPRVEISVVADDKNSVNAQLQLQIVVVLLRGKLRERARQSSYKVREQEKAFTAFRICLAFMRLGAQERTQLQFDYYCGIIVPRDDLTGRLSFPRAIARRDFRINRKLPDGRAGEGTRKSRGSPTRMDLARDRTERATLVERIMEFTCRIIIDSAMSRAPRLVYRALGAAPQPPRV